jgi:hypothetical protein
MGYIDYSETGSDTEDKTYTIRIRIKDEYEDISDLPADSLEKFSSVLSRLGRKKVVIGLRDRSTGPS